MEIWNLEYAAEFAVVIFLLDFISEFLYELLMVLYRKFCTVPRHHPHIPPIPTASSTSCLTTASRYSTYSTYTSSRQTTPRPALPTNVSISAQILWNYMKLDQDLKKVSGASVNTLTCRISVLEFLLIERLSKLYFYIIL